MKKRESDVSQRVDESEREAKASCARRERHADGLVDDDDKSP